MTETKRKGNVTTDLLGSRIAFWAGVSKGERGFRGVGVLLFSRLVSAAVEYKAINPTLLWVRLKLGLTRAFLLVAYAPDTGRKVYCCR